MSTKRKPAPDSIIREIKRKSRRKFSAKQKIRINPEGLRDEQRILDLFRCEGIYPWIYYEWSKAFYRLAIAFTSLGWTTVTFTWKR